MIMDINQIREYLPHRYPFLLVDRVMEITLANRSWRTRTSASTNPSSTATSPSSSDHAGRADHRSTGPGRGILGFKTVNKLPADGYVYYLVGSDNVRFKRPVMPGDQLKLEADVIKGKRGIWKFACRASVDGELACEGEIICAERKIA